MFPITPFSLLLTNLTISAILCGLIWTIQLVHYPSFLDVGPDQYVVFQQNHMKNISILVIPLMLLELGAGIYLQLEHLKENIHWLIYVASLLLLIIWVVTMFVASPLHGKLASQGYDKKGIQQLVNINWIRTVAWTLRTAIFFFLVWRYS